MENQPTLRKNLEQKTYVIEVYSKKLNKNIKIVVNNTLDDFIENLVKQSHWGLRPEWTDWSNWQNWDDWGQWGQWSAWDNAD